METRPLDAVTPALAVAAGATAVEVPLVGTPVVMDTAPPPSRSTAPAAVNRQLPTRPRQLPVGTVPLSPGVASSELSTMAPLKPVEPAFGDRMAFAPSCGVVRAGRAGDGWIRRQRR